MHTKLAWGAMTDALMFPNATALKNWAKVEQTDTQIPCSHSCLLTVSSIL